MLMNISSALLLVLQASGADASQQPATPAAPPPNCQTEKHAGFDFWLGEWDVYSASDLETKVANSRIERKHNGCAVLENWMPLSGAGGTSLNHYDTAAGQWKQKWVGSAPIAVEFTGGVADGAMVLVGNWPSPTVPHLLIRMTFTPKEDGSVRQHGEASSDHGLTWQTSFDFLYRPKPIIANQVEL